MGTTDLADDPSLDALVRRVVEVMRPLEVWLFGSRAEGRARPGSDYDLLVVVPDDAPESTFDLVRAWRIGRELRIPADIIPCTRSDFEEERDEIDTLARAAVSRGRKLYGR